MAHCVAQVATARCESTSYPASSITASSYAKYLVTRHGTCVGANGILDARFGGVLCRGAFRLAADEGNFPVAERIIPRQPYLVSM